MPTFKGEYEHSVDVKGRVAFPLKLRKALHPDAQDRLTLLRGIDPCIYLYPENEWEVVENKLLSINSFSKQGRLVKRNFLRYAEDLTLDKQNRIPIPQHLKEYAGITTKALFIGVGEFVEIWSPEKLDELDANFTDEAREELFENVLGGINLDANDS